LNIGFSFFKFTIGSFLVTASYVLVNNWDSIIVNNFFGEKVNGYYRSALILGSIPLILTTIISTRYLPQLSKLWDKGSKDSVKRFLLKISFGALLLFIVGLVGVFIVGKPIMSIFYNQYIADNGYIYFVLGYIASAIYVLGAINAIYLYVSHKVWYLTFVSVISAIVFVLASTFGSQTYGLIFVPISLIASNLLFTVLIGLRLIID